MMELEEIELEREAAHWAKSEMCREEGAGGRGGGTTRASPDSRAGKGNRNCDQKRETGRGWVGWRMKEEELRIGMGGNGGRIGRCFG